MDRTALLTGATGYVGTHLTRRLIGAGWTVHALVRPTSRALPVAEAGAHVHAVDERGVWEAVSGARPDVVIHLASEFQREDTPAAAERLVATNVLFATGLVEAALAAGCTRFVNTGTFWQHCNTAGYEPVDLYAATKQAFEDLLLYYHKVRGLSCVTLKLYDNYGPADPRRKIVNLLIDSCLSGVRLHLSPGEQTLDLTHIDDVADAFMAAADFVAVAPAPVWDVGFVSGERMKLKDLVSAVRKAAGTSARCSIMLGSRQYRCREIMEPVAGPAGAALRGWTPRLRLAESLPSLIAGWSSAADRP